MEKKHLTADFTGVLPENARIDLTRLKEEEVRALLRPEHADALAAEQNVFLLARQITVNEDWQPDGNVTVSFLHDKTLVLISPTGYVTRYAPFAMMIGFAIVLLMVIRGRRNDRADVI